MAKVRVGAFSLSLDGFGAGLDQSLQNPIGVNGMELHQWAFKTQTFRKMHGQEGGETGIDDQFAARSFEDVGAWVLGRNMFGPVRGPWPDESWKGWWGANPPYHVPVFVLTHHARSPIVMEGGTTFYFITDGAESALQQARDAAQGKDVRIGGGVRRSSSTCKLDSSMRCILQSRRSSSVQVNRCLPVSICVLSDMHALNVFPLRTRFISS